MKVFIVFLGLLVINVSFLSFQGDMGRYVRCQAFLKAVAEECAAGAALYYDEAAYSDGQMRFNYDESRKYIEYIIAESIRKSPFPNGADFTYEAVFQDDYLGYDSGQGSLGGGTPGDGRNPSVTVELTAETEDLFRLPFLEETEIKRTAKYELPQ